MYRNDPFLDRLEKLATRYDEEGDHPRALEIYQEVIEALQGVIKVTQDTSEKRHLENLCHRLVQRASYLGGTVHNGSYSGIISKAEKEENLIADLVKTKGLPEERLRLGISKLKLIGMDIEEPNFEAVLCDHVTRKLFTSPCEGEFSNSIPLLKSSTQTTASRGYLEVHQFTEKSDPLVQQASQLVSQPQTLQAQSLSSFGSQSYSRTLR
eukprot:TRINITY_DN28635_c0_g1_i1.p1 TRINITY_DN28635_c0_g1~~TRINITY_DN28635_c0_g1_i1.p1  ORF type:complete len:210 (-),score=33.33 TRINITY_DN28635_c0_g1_i1:6-635(-)